ncbi:hypothetical protein [Dyella choica]|uniref:Uncharacterized protein n=1 Tax=Dyella choica TaxID=1927959 RepID=A0A3S0PR97_9GAMM|nr:hypothetical protein [Dyella choica]RUL79653.1 hypothetical protein EKH80_00115 [Dyella choica]
MDSPHLNYASRLNHREIDVVIEDASIIAQLADRDVLRNAQARALLRAAPLLTVLAKSEALARIVR